MFDHLANFAILRRVNVSDRRMAFLFTSRPGLSKLQGIVSIRLKNVKAMKLLAIKFCRNFISIPS
jgi:hypothetical protein